MKIRNVIDAVILFVLFLSLATMLDFSRQRALPSWTFGLPLIALGVAYVLGRARGRREQS